MANIRINSLPATASVLTDDVLPMDGATTRKIRPVDMVNSVRPLSTQSQAEAGTDNTTSMTPLATFQAIDAKLPNTAAGRGMLAAANPAAQRTLLGLGGAAQLSIGTTAGTVAAGDDSRILGALQKADNLSDVPNKPTARTNLGLGNAAVLNTGTSAGNLVVLDGAARLPAVDGSQLTGVPNALTDGNKGGVTVSGAGATWTVNVPSIVGSTAGTAAAGDDSRITGAAQKTANLSDLADAGTARNNLGLGLPDIHSAWYGAGVAGLQAAIDAALVSGIKSVFVTPGTYVLTTTPLYMQAGVRVWATPGTAIITQANGASLTVLVDFNTNAAAGAQIDGLIIDGNGANNPANVTGDRFAVFVNAISSARVINNEIRNYMGHGVYASIGVNLEVRGNYLHHLNLFGVYVVSSTTALRNAPIIDRNRLVLCGWHGIAVVRSNSAQITNNDVVGTRVSGVVVNVSGTTVTWVSGPNFADIVPGNFIIYNGGIEALVTAKASNTSLTINHAAGNGSNLPAALGAADVIGSWSSLNTRIAGNTVNGSASLAYSIFSDQTNHAEDDVGCLVENNVAVGVGSAGFSIQSSGAGAVRSCAIRNNQAIECGLNGTASAAPFNSGLTVSGAINNIIVEGNQWVSYGSTMAPMHISTSTLGQVFTANNRAKTVATGITNGAAVSASLGWGSGATVDISVVADDYLLLVVVAGSGPSASPSITIQHKNLPMRRKMPSAQIISSTSTIAPMVTYLPDGETDTAVIFSGTPSASQAYYILVRL